MTASSIVNGTRNGSFKRFTSFERETKKSCLKTTVSTRVPCTHLGTLNEFTGFAITRIHNKVKYDNIVSFELFLNNSMDQREREAYKHNGR